jgi:ATP-dependent RNA helicase RhlE
MSFSSFGLHPDLLQALKDLEFTQPTPIQEKALPPLLKGRHVLAAAATGSGKTAAFLLPILQRFLDHPGKGTRALILAPTRELAAQIADHLKALARHTPIRGVAIYGGVGMEPQVKALKKGVEVVIATPGRLLDHMQYPYTQLGALEFLVLDEADRMLDMGFLPDVRRILERLPKSRQTLLFSATLPLPIVELASEMLASPIAINVEQKSEPAAGISHSAYPVPHELKSHLLLEILKLPEARSVLAFTRTKHRANRLADFLEKRKISCARIHGGRSQFQRTEAMTGFKAGRFQVLVATDIASRGIDVEALGLVVNFDVPHLPEEYIHRVGRTARAQATGEACTLVSPQEEGDFREIERHLGWKIPRRTLEGFDYSRRPEERFEVPLEERIAAIRKRKAEERARARTKAERRVSAGRNPQKAPAADREAGSRRPGDAPSRAGEGRAVAGSSPKAHGRDNAPRRSHAEGPGARGKAHPHRSGAPRPGWKPKHGSAQSTGDAAHPMAVPPSSGPRDQTHLPDTSGTRQDTFVSHRDSLAGRSHWGQTWKKKFGGRPSEQVPDENQPDS